MYQIYIILQVLHSLQPTISRINQIGENPQNTTKYS